MKFFLTIVGALIAGFVFFSWYGGNTKKITSDNLTNIEVVEANVTTDSDGELNAPEAVSGKTNSKKIEATKVVLSANQIQAGIDKLAGTAITAALKENDYVPAGVSLALLIQQAQENGKQLSKENLNTLIKFLREKKATASTHKRALYGYATNSEKWFSAMNDEFDEESLKKIYKEYDLKKFDEQVYEKRMNFTTEVTEAVKKVETEMVIDAEKYNMNESVRSTVVSKHRKERVEHKRTPEQLKSYLNKTYSKVEQDHLAAKKEEIAQKNWNRTWDEAMANKRTKKLAEKAYNSYVNGEEFASWRKQRERLKNIRASAS